jgi:hypothetical protein
MIKWRTQGLVLAGQPDNVQLCLEGIFDQPNSTVRIELAIMSGVVEQERRVLYQHSQGGGEHAEYDEDWFKRRYGHMFDKRYQSLLTGGFSALGK